MIFVAANARQGRLIKPQLKFHQASKIPVYATSHISSSKADPDKDRDLDEVLFVDTPWALKSKNNPDFANITQYWPQQSQRYGKLFALGIDAYQIIPSLRRLMLHQQESLMQNSGELSIDNMGRVHRKLYLAIFNRGRAILEQTQINK